MSAHQIVLQANSQRLVVLPDIGGSLASWEGQSNDGAWRPIFRPWDGASDDRYTLAFFPLVPWSNRITRGGFEQDGVFYPIRNNRSTEAYPLHGDGWLQAWRVLDQTDNSIKLVLESHGFDGNPYHYKSTETFHLLPEGLAVDLTVTHLGENPLPYGLGMHPYFVRNEQTTLCFKSEGVWLSGEDPIPTEYTTDFPPTWDYNRPARLEGPMIDNCFAGWDGTAVIDYPDRGMKVTMTMADCTGYTLMYRPPDFPYFCLEPITHPIDAFHMPGCPGLVVLQRGQSLSLKTRFSIELSQVK